jgi:hypothetical protein
MGATTNENIESYNRKYGNYLIGKGTSYICNRCKNVWEPNDQDINRKAMMCYYKCCTSCRLYLYNKKVIRDNKK